MRKILSTILIFLLCFSLFRILIQKEPLTTIEFLRTLNTLDIDFTKTTSFWDISWENYISAIYNIPPVEVNGIQDIDNVLLLIPRTLVYVVTVIDKFIKLFGVIGVFIVDFAELVASVAVTLRKLVGL